MIQDDETILDVFAKGFNSRFNTLDFIDNSNKLIDILNNGIAKETRHLISLPCGSLKILNQLIAFRYKELIANIIKRVKIEEESKDNYLSEMDSAMVEIYSNCLLLISSISIVEINHTNKSFDIKCPELLVDLLWSPISQFHTQVLAELEHLNEITGISTKYFEMTSNEPVSYKGFINSRVSTAYSYFILVYIAENLNIPLKM